MLLKQRLVGRPGHPSYLCCLAAHYRWEDKRTQHVAGSLGQIEEKISSMCASLSLQVDSAAGGVARFTFSELCDTAKGASDYYAIAEHFHTVFLEGVPAMSLQVWTSPANICHPHYVR